MRNNRKIMFFMYNLISIYEILRKELYGKSHRHSIQFNMKFKPFLEYLLLSRKNTYDVQIETTNLCNAKCTFCPNSYLIRKKLIMSNEVFRTILSRIKKEKLNVRQFTLHINGEPLTDPHLTKRIKVIKKMFPNAAVRFTTNFSLATKEIIDRLLQCGLDSIIISMNSIVPEEYEKIMGGISYYKTIENLDMLLERKKELKSDLNIELSIVAKKDNKKEVAGFIQYWRKRNIKIRVIKLGKWVGKDIPKGYDNTIRENSDYGCSSLYNTISFLSNGDYALCCFDAEGVVHKNVLDSPIRKTYRSGIYNKIRLHHLKYGRTNAECCNCSFR